MIIKGLKSKCCNAEVRNWADGYICMKCKEDCEVVKEKEETCPHCGHYCTGKSVFCNQPQIHREIVEQSDITIKNVDEIFNSFCITGKISTVHANEIKQQLRDLSNKIIKKRDEEIAEKLWQMFNLVVDDMPTVSPDDKDPIGTVVVSGINKLKNK